MTATEQLSMESPSGRVLEGNASLLQVTLWSVSWKGGMLLQGDIARPCQTLQMVHPSSPEGLRAADRSKSIGHLTFPQCQEEITDQEEQHMLNQALQREARSSGGTESYLSNKHCSFSTTCAVGQSCHHLWAARGLTSSLASARCHHSSSCSKGHIQNECL